MAELSIDWCLKAASLKKELLKLNKSKLIKLCKCNKISTNGSKQDMADLLIKHKKNGNETVKSRRTSVAPHNKQSQKASKSSSKSNENANKKVSFDNTENDYSTTLNADQEQRKEWKIGSKVEVYSLSNDKWEKGKIIKILNDTKGEWLEVRYCGFSTVQIQRYNSYIRPIEKKKTKKNVKK